MSVSKKDWVFMEQVAAYYRSTVSLQEPNGSIRDTAMHFNINRNKVRKILVTMGELSSLITENACALRQQGMSIKEIASVLGVSVATVSTALPYEDKVDNSLEPSKHAAAVREYRAYEKRQRERQVERDMLKSEGTMHKQSKMETATGKQSASGTGKVICLHLEVYNEYMSEHEVNVLKRFGGVRYGKTISRDMVVPYDIPLYALHYAFQRAFGWQNSHLRQFYLPSERFCEITKNCAEGWRELVGTVFRSPLMGDTEEFWADDYDKGSFKNWLRSKYTGPYCSLCRGETLAACRADMEELDWEEEHYLLYERAYNHLSGEYDGEEFLSDVVPVYDWEGKEREEPKPWRGQKSEARVERRVLREVPADGLRFVFERNPFALLERLSIGSVLASGKRRLTDVLFYNYDFGDNWEIKITLGDEGAELVKNGRISQSALDKAVAKCCTLYRPVLLARDGEMLIDDVGGLHGFVDFLEKIFPELDGLSEDEAAEALQEREEYLVWARSLGWHKDDATDINLL